MAGDFLVHFVKSRDRGWYARRDAAAWTPTDTTRVKLILFDCDGTLVDSQHMIVAAMQKAYGAHGLICPPRESILSIVGLSLAEAFETLARDAVHPVADLVESYKLAFQDLRRGGDSLEPLFPGARDAVDALAREPDTVLGIVTGKSQRGVRAVLGHHGLYERFGVIKTADDAPSKPHPGHGARCDARDGGRAGRYSRDRRYRVRHGDGPRGTHCSIGVAWGYHAPQSLADAGAFRVIAHFGELPETLAALWASGGSVAISAIPALPLKDSRA